MAERLLVTLRAKSSGRLAVLVGVEEVGGQDRGVRDLLDLVVVLEVLVIKIQTSMLFVYRTDSTKFRLM